MMIKSFYVPKEALQGESVPSFVLWKDIKYHTIRFEYSPSLKLSQLFNVNKDMVDQEDQAFQVNRVEKEGYLGCVFSSRKLEDTMSEAKLAVTFLDAEKRVIVRKEKSLTLFGPALTAEHIPRIITVKPGGVSLEENIHLRKSGKGTLIVSIDPTSESEIAADEPEAIREFKRKYLEDITNGLQKLIVEFPEEKEVTLLLLRTVKTPVDLSDASTLKNLESLGRRIEETANEKYTNRLVETIISAVIKNVHLVTIFQLFVDHVNSIGASRWVKTIVS